MSDLPIQDASYAPEGGKYGKHEIASELVWLYRMALQRGANGGNLEVAMNALELLIKLQYPYIA